MVKKIMCSLLMSSFCLIANLAEAKNLIGTDYVRVISGVTWPDDGSEHSYQAGMTYNRNLNDHTDVQVDLHTAWNDEPSSDGKLIIYRPASSGIRAASKWVTPLLTQT